MIDKFEGRQPISWPMDFDQPHQTEFSGPVPKMTEEEYLRLRREADQSGLGLLQQQRSLYIRTGDIPNQLNMDIDTYRLRLALTDQDGKKLLPEQAIENLCRLVENGSLHGNGVAKLLIKDFEEELGST